MSLSLYEGPSKRIEYGPREIFEEGPIACVDENLDRHPWVELLRFHGTREIVGDLQLCAKIRLMGNLIRQPVRGNLCDSGQDLRGQAHVEGRQPQFCRLADTDHVYVLRS